MKFVISFLVLIFSPLVLAQSVDVKDVAAGDSQTTTIEIRKGSKAESAKDAQWEVVNGSADIEGDEAPMKRAARKNWKQACKVWKQEFRQDNKENKIISMNCGKPNCQGQSGGTICTSQASFQIKTKLN